MMNGSSNAAAPTSMLQVPVGFRFHPTDEELVGYYLHGKVASEKPELDIIRDLDLYKLEPWDLHELCKMGKDSSSVKQTDWYFFSHKDRKYPTGYRANRATAAGFWKATGRDKPVHCTKLGLIGMRKTLVFYTGRAPHGQKTDWIMHEFRLEGTSSPHMQHYEVGGWVVCRVFRKIKTSLKTKRSHEKNACSLAEEQDIALLMPELSSSGSPSAEIQLSCSESAAGGGEWVACDYPPAQPQEMQLQEQCLCKQEIDIDDYQYEINQDDNSPAVFPGDLLRLQQVAAEIPHLEEVGYMTNPRTSPASSNFGGLIHGKKLDDCFHMMQQQSNSVADFEVGTRWSDDSSTDQGTLSALTNCYDETALDWIFEDVATRDHMIMQARSIPSVRGDELLGDVINHHLQA